MQRDGVGRRADTGHLDERALGLLGDRFGNENHGGRAVADRRAVEKTKRIGHLGGREHLIDRDARMDLRARIEEAVLVVFHRDARDLLARRTVLMHVRARHHRVEPGKRDAVEGLVLLVGSGSERAGHVGAVGHLLDPAREHDLAGPRSNFEERRPKRHAAARARRFDAHRGHGSHAEVVGEQRREMLLLDEEPAAHAADVHAVELVDPSVADRFGWQPARRDRGASAPRARRSASDQLPMT